ncbi:hypothetical protein POG23_13190 [Limnoraphis robusta]|uniref:hypothetical protein n=1 Tax=Limnospira sp. TaxID=3100384 RepID=UPI003F727923|nr:hypothetical protein [Limnoraphis robusta]
MVSDRPMLSLSPRNGWEMLMSDAPELYTPSATANATPPLSQKSSNQNPWGCR